MEFDCQLFSLSVVNHVYLIKLITYQHVLVILFTFVGEVRMIFINLTTLYLNILTVSSLLPLSSQTCFLNLLVKLIEILQSNHRKIYFYSEAV